MKTERRVYVLGAGASEGAGLPLMGNFLEKAEKLKEMKKKYLFNWDGILNKDREKFVGFLMRYSGNKWVKDAKIEKIGDGKTIKVYTKKNSILVKLKDKKVEINFKGGWTDKLIVNEENNELKLYEKDSFDDIWEYRTLNKLENFNIEDILGYLDMKIDNNCLDSEKDKDVRIHGMFLELIEKVIKDSLYYSEEKNFSDYFKLLEKFVRNLTENDAIITFNYDPLIDACLDRISLSPDYGAIFENKESYKSDKKIPLIKLHGSLNWRICPVCKKPIWLDYDYLLPKRDISSTKIDYDLYDLFSENLTLCQKKHNRSYMVENTLIVPPSWNKSDYPYISEFIKELRKSASEKLKIADKIIFIGYSLPQTDTYFKYLLLSSLPKTVSVEVVDPRIEKIAGRYLEIFRDNISFKAMKFEKYIE